MSQQSLDDLWVLDGKVYDMEPFLDRHPGGRTFLMVGKGRDCTELFKSVHCLSKVDFAPILSKYEVHSYAGDRSTESLFDWSGKSRFWADLTQEVGAYFEERKLSYKASREFWVWCAVFLVAMVWAFNLLVSSANPILGYLFGVAVGMSGFFLMHSGSHGALSKAAWINEGVTILWCHYTWWHAWIWLQHHVYGHHSYTGLHGKDPDVRNMVPFARKHPEQKPVALGKYQGWAPFVFLLLLPNQFVGQVLVYLHSMTRDRVFGMPLKFPQIHSYEWVYNLLPLLSAVLMLFYPMTIHGLGFLPALFAYWGGLGFAYWAVTFPNHDTDGVRLNAEKQNKADEEWKTKDWGVLQVVHTSNFYLPGPISQLFGGMNYQIEHHLLPAVHPIHYPAISQIVQRLCKKHGLPYLCYPSWFHSLFAHWKLLNNLSSNKKDISKVAISAAVKAA